MAVGWEPVLMVSVGVIVPSLLRRLAGHEAVLVRSEAEKILCSAALTSFRRPTRLLLFTFTRP